MKFEEIVRNNIANQFIKKYENKQKEVCIINTIRSIQSLFIKTKFIDEDDFSAYPILLIYKKKYNSIKIRYHRIIANKKIVELLEKKSAKTRRILLKKALLSEING